jgi:hypothetical protein
VSLTPEEFKRRIATARRLADAARGGRLSCSEVGGGYGQIELKVGGQTFHFGGAVTDADAKLLVHCTNLVLDHLRSETIDSSNDGTA